MLEATADVLETTAAHNSSDVLKTTVTHDSFDVLKTTAAHNSFDVLETTATRDSFLHDITDSDCWALSRFCNFQASIFNQQD